MYTLTHLKAQIKTILETAQLDPKFEEPLKVLKKGIEEYASELQNHGEGWTDEGETFDFKAKAAPAGDNGEWEQKYNALMDRYTEAFLYGDAAANDGTVRSFSQNTGNAGNPSPPAEPINEAEEMTYDDLFEVTE